MCMFQVLLKCNGGAINPVMFIKLLRIMYIMLNELFRSILVYLKVVNYSSVLLEIYLCLTTKQNKQKTTNNYP